MKEIIANCGLVCSACAAYVAGQSDDQELRQSTASQWSEMYQTDILPEEINCDGCNSCDGLLFKHCLICEIRICCQKKELEHCVFCDEQPCEKLLSFHNRAPEAKAGFDTYLSAINPIK